MSTTRVLQRGTRTLLAVVGVAIAAACAPGEADIPTPDDLAGALVTAEDLGPIAGSWSQADYFDEWPGGRPGVVPDDFQEWTKTLDMLAWLGCEGVVGVEDGLSWQAHTLYQPTNLNTTIRTASIGENLLGGDPSEIKEQYAALRDALSSCVGTPAAHEELLEFSVETLDLPQVGDDRFGLLVHESADLYESLEGMEYVETAELRVAVVRDGPVLMLLLGGEAGEVVPQILTNAHFAAAVEAAAAQLP